MKRALVLFFLMAATLSSAFLLPDFKQTESAIRLEVPVNLADWKCHSYEASKKERDTLAPDTMFSKAACLREKPGPRPWFQTDLSLQRADLSIVLSGYDLANSIHRPERCMPAQGHKIDSSEERQVEVAGRGALQARRLLSRQQLEDPAKKSTQVDCITYYFFVGHNRITADHTKRTLFDIGDRLFKGQAQKWAYVSVTMQYRGSHPSGNGDLPDLETADEAVRRLIGELAAQNIEWSRIQL